MHCTVIILFIWLPTVIPLASVLVSSPFDNFRIECPQSSGAQRLAIRMVESQGQKRQDTVFVLSCQHILELYPWLELPQEIADQEREDCRYTPQFDMLLDQKLDLTCKEREYLAGIARLADTRIQLECCRMRTRVETGCVQLEYDKPLASGARTEIEYQAKVINAISIEGSTIRVRFCDLSPRAIDDIMEDIAKATTTTTTTRQTATTARSTTLGWWQTTHFAWSPNDEEIPGHPILNHPKLRRRYHWPSDTHPNTIGPIHAAPIPIQKANPTLAPSQQQPTLPTEHTFVPDESEEEELVVPDEILHVDEIGTAPQRLFPSPSPIRVVQHNPQQQQQQQQNGGVPQQVISVQPVPLTPFQWQFGQNVTITKTIQFDEKQQKWEGTVDPFHRGGGGGQQQQVSATQHQQAQKDEAKTATPSQRQGQQNPKNGERIQSATKNEGDQTPHDQTGFLNEKQQQKVQEQKIAIQNSHEQTNKQFHHDRAVSVTQQPQIDSLKLPREQHEQQQRQMDQENMDDPFHHSQTVTAAQPVPNQTVTTTQPAQNQTVAATQPAAQLKQNLTGNKQQQGTMEIQKKLAYSSTNEDDDAEEEEDDDDNDESDRLDRQKGNKQQDQAEQQRPVDEQQQLEEQKQRNDRKGDKKDNDQQNETEQQQLTDNHVAEEKPQKTDQKEAINLMKTDQAEQDQTQQGKHEQPTLTAKQIEDVQQQEYPPSDNSSVISGNGSHHVQAVQEQKLDNKKHRNRNDLSFHVIKGFSTRGSKVSFPRSSLLIRRKGLRELTVTLLPPKVGQPIGPRISADRERQMAEIAIQERVDSIRKIEKGIQLDNNTEAPLPQWVIPLMSGKMITLNSSDENTETRHQNITELGEKLKNQTAQQTNAMEVENRIEEVQAVTEEQLGKTHQQAQRKDGDKKGVAKDQQEEAQQIKAEQQHQQTQRAQAVPQPSGNEQTTEHQQEPNGESNDSMHQILFGEPAKPVIVVQKQMKKKDKAEQKPAFHVVHSLLWPTQRNDDESGDKLDSRGQQLQDVQQRENFKNQNEVQMTEFLNETQLENKNNIERAINDSGRDGAVPVEHQRLYESKDEDVQYRNSIAQQFGVANEQQSVQMMQQNSTNFSQHDGAVLVEQHDENNENSDTVQKQQAERNADEKHEFGQQNQTVQEAHDQTDQLKLVMSVSGIIRKPLRRLNIQAIQNGTELQMSPENKNAVVGAQNGSIETMMFPMTEENEKHLRTSQENYVKNSQEFADSMMSAIERHVAETMHGIYINPDKQDKINATGKSNQRREQTQFENNDNFGANKSTTVFTQLSNTTKVSNGPKKRIKEALNEAKNQETPKHVESEEMSAKKSAETEETGDQKITTLRQVQIGASRRLVMLRDDVGEAPKRRKNNKKRRGRKKINRNSAQNHHPLTTEDVFGTGRVNLPKTELARPPKELSEEALLDEELPPSPAELPPFDAFPSPPPTSQHRNSQIGTQLAQLPDYGKTAKNSAKNLTKKAIKTTTPSITTSSPSADDDEQQHTEETTTTTEVPEKAMEMPRSKLPSDRKVPNSARRRHFEKSSQIARDEQRHNVPPRRVFPSRRGQTTQTTAIGPIGGGLPDEETDSSPFDAERAERLWHSKQEQTRRVAADTEEQKHQTTIKNDEEENDEQISMTTSPIPNSRRQIKVERVESHFEAKSPFEKEIRRKPIVDVSFPKQQSSGDEENRSNEKQDEGEKAPKDHDIIQKDGQPLYSPPYNRPMLMPDGKGTGTMPNIGETNDSGTEEKEVEQSLVPMGEGETVVVKTLAAMEEEASKNEIENSTPITSTTSSSSATPITSTTTSSGVVELSTIEMLSTQQNALRHQRGGGPYRRRIGTTTSSSSTMSATTTSNPSVSVNGENFWVSTRSTVATPYYHHATPYDIAKFYRMPLGNPTQRETVLTFCSKRAAIRDSANMVIACAGEDGEIWTPSRCPPGTDCLPAADSTFRICCPVAVGKR